MYVHTYIHACMYVCMYVCIRTYMYVCMYVRTCVYVRTYIHVCMYVYVCTAAPMKRVKLTAKPVSKNWSMEKQGQHYDKTKLASRNPTPHNIIIQILRSLCFCSLTMAALQ